MPSSRAKRSRLYFRLMDVCLFFAGVGLADFLLGRLFDRTLMPGNSLIYLGTGVITLFFNFFVPPFLMVARFIRDEYAEQLWERSIKLLVYVFAIAPLLLQLVLMYVEFARPPDPTMGPFTYLFGEVPAGVLIYDIWSAFLLLWVAIFQFLRWRDER